MRIYHSFKEFFQKVGRHLIHMRERTQKKLLKGSTQEQQARMLREARADMKANGYKARVTKSKAGLFKATVRSQEGKVFIGTGSTELGAIITALDGNPFVYPAVKEPNKEAMGAMI